MNELSFFDTLITKIYRKILVMFDSEISNENFKQIEDIIDARKKLGIYNVIKQENSRYTYSHANTSPNINDRYVRFDDTILNDSTTNLKLTDSDVTIVRVRCGGTAFKRCQSKWDMEDAAIPGDGSHLGESPSMVNLATLINQHAINISSEANEYLVPLSSWDPYKNEDNSISVKSPSSDSNTLQGSEENYKSKRNSLGRISQFIKKHYRKGKHE